MIARVTLAEVDTVRTSVAQALEVYRQSVVPTLDEQDGYVGVMVFATQEGKAMVMSLWESEETAQAGVASGYYEEQISKFVTFYRAEPGREMYDLLYAQIPALSGEPGP